VKSTVSKEVVKLVQSLEHSPQVRKLLIILAVMVVAPYSLAALITAVRWW